MRPEDRDRILVEVTSRITEHYTQLARGAPDGFLEELVNDTLYHEKLRLGTENPKDPATRRYKAFYAAMQRELKGASSHVLQRMVSDLARHFAQEVVGNFNRRVYRLSTRVIPVGLSALLGASSLPGMFSRPGDGNLLDRHLEVRGELDAVRALLGKGTLLVVPTHSSNLDSIVLGYSAFKESIPPLLYGAGLNLFTNPLISFFMRNLGAYRVDRKKKSRIYKDVLKQYSVCALQMGYHSLFFPGGTRSRSGAVEQKLKKGLLGTAMEAYVRNLMDGKPSPSIYIVPCTISYKLVLEAETLIGDHLQDVGRSRYIITDDEFSRPRRIYDFFRNLVSLDDNIVITYSRPMDVLGNPVDDRGRSRDPRGRPVDPSTYVTRGGEPVMDPQRDREYTSELARLIAQNYLGSNVIMSTNLVASAVDSLLRRSNPGMDRYRLLHTGGDQQSFPMSQVHAETGRQLKALGTCPGPRPILGDDLLSDDIQEIVSDAIRHFSIYHTRPAVERRGDRLFHMDRNLLLYYGNRLKGYRLDGQAASR